MSDIAEELKGIISEINEASQEIEMAQVSAATIERWKSEVEALKRSEEMAWKTLIALAEKLGISPEEARKQADKPSDVYMTHIRAIEQQKDRMKSALVAFMKEAEFKQMVCGTMGHLAAPYEAGKDALESEITK